jgi:hypothetical protein
MVNKNFHLSAALGAELKAILTDRNDAGEGGGTTTTLSFTTGDEMSGENIDHNPHGRGTTRSDTIDFKRIFF